MGRSRRLKSKLLFSCPACFCFSFALVFVLIYHGAYMCFMCISPGAKLRCRILSTSSFFDVPTLSMPNIYHLSLSKSCVASSQKFSNVYISIYCHQRRSVISVKESRLTFYHPLVHCKNYAIILIFYKRVLRHLDLPHVGHQANQRLLLDLMTLPSYFHQAIP